MAIGVQPVCVLMNSQVASAVEGKDRTAQVSLCPALDLCRALQQASLVGNLDNYSL